MSTTSPHSDGPSKFPMSTDFKLSCVLFDLDGTLVDTAPDLVASLNKALAEHGFAVVTPEAIRPFISYGGAAMVRESVGTDADQEIQAAVLKSMLDHYQSNIAEHTAFFSGMTETLSIIEALGIEMGRCDQ